MRSARYLSAGAALLLIAAGSLAGCTTTQQKAARLQLNNARLRATQQSTRVSTASRAVAVTAVSLIRAPGRAAIVVAVHNRGRRPVSDLPISVGYRIGDGSPVYLNGSAGADYFDAHLPSIDRGRTFTWVYLADQQVPAEGRPFAVVGAVPTVRVAGLAAAPAIAAGVKTAAAGDAIHVSVRNLSGVTQYQLPVYAVAERGSRVLAAGAATIEQLGGGASETLQLKLLGSADGARVALEARPTIFQ